MNRMGHGLRLDLMDKNLANASASVDVDDLEIRYGGSRFGKREY